MSVARHAWRSLLANAVLGLSAALVVPPASAEEAPPVWNALSATQQQQLGPLRREWPRIDAARKQKWLELVGRFAELPPEERSRIQQRMAEWARLPANERNHARQQFQEASKLSTDERRARWLEYQALPAETRQQLLQQANQRQRLREERLPAANEAPGSSAPRAKTNVLPLHTAPHSQAVAPALVQARPGATTTLSKPPQPAQFQQAGLPKIAATPDFVDPTTMQPRRGAQAAATVGVPRARSADKSASSASSASRSKSSLKGANN